MPATVAPSTIDSGREADWEPPNILFVVADDLGYGDPGCYGGDRLQTPAMDRLAADGTRFTHCYTGSPVCAPSRSVLVTGQHAGHTRVRHNAGEAGGARVVDDGSLQHRVPLGPDDPSLAAVLSAAGYATGGFGKWGLGEPDTSGMPTRQGFDEWFGYLNQRRAHVYYPPFLWDGETRVPVEGNEGDGREQHAQDLVMDRATAFVRRHADERFFCFLPTTLPHAPWDVPDAASVAPYVDEDWSDDAKARASMVTRLDSDVGRLLELLEELGIDDDTIVFVCSDHGPPQQWLGEPLRASGELTGGKRDLSEGGIRTPMIVRWPEAVPAARVDDSPWYYADLLPTMAELAGVWPDPGVQAVTDADGLSVVPTLLGDDQPLDRRFLYWEFPDGEWGQAARIRDWKAIRPGVGEPIQLYDVVDDPAEAVDLADDRPDLVARFEWFLNRAHDPSKHWPWW